MSAPLPLPERLDTPRLSLRLWDDDDVEVLREALAESVEHLRRWIPWATAHAPSSAEVRALVARWRDQRAAGENVLWALVERPGTIVGGIGVYRRVGAGALEIGYWLRASAAGRGLATEATRCVVAAGFAVPGVERLEIHTHPGNHASRRIPVKLGFRLREGTGAGTVVYERDRAGWTGGADPPSERPGS